MWMCRGCKDPVQEPAAESVRPVNEISTTSESSTEVIYFFSKAPGYEAVPMGFGCAVVRGSAFLL
jgi:hypothetical protein